MTALQTARLTSEHDLDDLSVLMANADFMRFSLGVFSRAQTAGFLEKVRKRDRAGLPSQFALILRPARILIGSGGFFLQTVDNVEELEIAYRLDFSYWGQDIATEAARAVRDHAFEELRLSHVISLIHRRTPRRAALRKKME
jgi:ribosomal-protein-alanine N-acetyltransferase